MVPVPSPLRRAVRRGLAALVLLAPLAPSALGSAASPSAPASPVHLLPGDPFAPGLRWSVEPAPAEPWIPRDLTLAAGDLVWVAAEGAARHLALIPLDAREPAGPLFVDVAGAAGNGALAVAAGTGSRRLFSAVQVPDPDALHRRTRITMHDPALPAQGGVHAASWTHDLLEHANGPARIACDRAGELVVAAAWDAEGAFARLDWIVGASGLRLTRVEIPATALGGLALAEDGSRAFVVLGTRLFVFDELGQRVGELELGASTRALAPTADGRRVLVGGLGEARWCAEGATAWSVERTVLGGGGELAAAVACSPDGSTWAIGWWRYVTGTSLRFELRDGASGAQIFSLEQSGARGGLQNLPQVVRVSRDGARAALGAWGGGGQAELLLVQREPPAVLLAVDLPGSVEDLELDERGERVVVASKSVHANQLGGTGSVRAYEVGGRDLVQLAPAVAGGRLELAARGPADGLCLFLLGKRRETPFGQGPLAGLWLQRDTRLVVLPRPTDGAGRAALELDLPGGVGLVGRILWGQALFRTGGATLVGTSLEPIVIL